ncbi:uncharacterized protein N7483_002589 [Penicillium malachiteum]|uniref:uncharacterized protein n=1 Tax=Penicillium malachiteum TaxID=1324776 RepID=UPI0025466D6A|nr:uncharacterized protein N7483_002589 [Penicillium malachiteum]KAJ5737464.1 hypothetical protein N7483_002589 [Penicillium malachiteum]
MYDTYEPGHQAQLNFDSLRFFHYDSTSNLSCAAVPASLMPLKTALDTRLATSPIHPQLPQVNTTKMVQLSARCLERLPPSSTSCIKAHAANISRGVTMNQCARQVYKHTPLWTKRYGGQLGDGRDYRTLVPAISQMIPVVRPTHYGEKVGPSVEHTV